MSSFWLAISPSKHSKLVKRIASDSLDWRSRICSGLITPLPYSSKERKASSHHRCHVVCPWVFCQSMRAEAN
jgi:hypothetical protein